MLMKNKNANKTNETNDTNEEVLLYKDFYHQIFGYSAQTRLIVYSYSYNSRYSSHSR